MLHNSPPFVLLSPLSLNSAVAAFYFFFIGSILFLLLPVVFVPTVWVWFMCCSVFSVASARRRETNGWIILYLKDGCLLFMCLARPLIFLHNNFFIRRIISYLWACSISSFFLLHIAHIFSLFLPLVSSQILVENALLRDIVFVVKVPLPTSSTF